MTALDKQGVAASKHGVILVLAAIMPTMAIISLVPVLPLFMKEFAYIEGAEFLVPMAMTIPALCVALFSPIAGWLSDRVGRKPVLLTALIIYAFIGLAPFFLTNLFHIILSRVVLGMAEAAIMTVATALIADYYTGKARQRWVTIQIASVSISAIVLIAFGGILGELLGSRGPFLLYILALPIALLVHQVLFEPSASSKNTASGVRTPWRDILPILITTLFVGVIFYTIIVKLGEILALSAEVSPGVIGGIGAAANIGVALGSIAFKKAKGLTGPSLIAGGLILATLGYVGAAVSTSLVMTSVSVVIACLGFGLLLPTTLNWVLKVLPVNVRGKGTGLWTGAFFLGQFSAPILVTLLQVEFGGLYNVLMLFAALAFLAALLALVKTKHAQPLVAK